MGRSYLRMEVESHVPEMDSASALPSPKKTEAVVKESVIRPVTTSTSDVQVYERQIAVRGTETQKITVAINAERERRVYENLLANRGPIEVETTSGYED